MAEGIPCTTVTRTILDIAGREPRRNVERLLDQAEILRLFDLTAMEETLARANGHRGVGVVRAILADYDAGENLTRNELEEALFQICDAAGLPRPGVNVWIALPGRGFEADFAWAVQKVIAEADGWSTHGTRHAFEWDRARDRRLRLAGWQVLRFTRREVVRTPEVVAEDLRDALGEA